MNKRLLLILVLLLGIWAITHFISGDKERSFNANLIQLDTANIETIILNTKVDNFEETRLQKQDNQWLITKGALTAKAMNQNVQGLIAQLLDIKAKRIVAKKSDKWAEYEVGEGQGTRVRVKGDKIDEDFIVGRFNFNQQTRSGISYIRFSNEDEVFAVDGLLSLGFGQGFDSYRDKTFIKFNANDLTAIQLENETLSLNYTKTNNQWMNGDIVLDSTMMANYITSLQNMNGTEFVNDFDELKADELRTHKLSLQANNILEPISVQCYTDAQRTKPFILQSSLNQDAYFASDSTGIFSTIFNTIPK